MFRNLIALLAAAILLVLGFIFSVVALVVIAVLGLAVWAYLWWKTRELRRVMRQHAADGQVIEGEAIVVEESTVTTEHDIPR